MTLKRKHSRSESGPSADECDEKAVSAQCAVNGGENELKPQNQSGSENAKQELCFRKTTINHHLLRPNSRDSILAIASKCARCHRVDDCLRMMRMIVKNKKMPHEFIFKIGSLLVSSFNAKSYEQLSEAMREFMIYCLMLDYDKGEIFLETLIFYITRSDGQLSDAIRLIESHLSTIVKIKNRRNEEVVLFARLYSAFIWYLQWEQNYAKIKSSCELVYLENGVDLHITQLTDVFKLALTSKAPGVDMFVIALIRIYIYYDRNEEALQSLIKFSETQSDNPNAYIYLYKFIVAFFNDDENSVDLKMRCCKNLANLSPFDPYLEDMIKENLLDTVESLKILMNYVDHKDKKNDENVWRLIANFVQKIEPSSDCEKQVKYLYENMFKSYWPQYHFDSQHLRGEESSGLLNYKHTVASFFESENCSPI